ncbi:MAG: GntR family transcriptional regulator [Spirochaetota bacterium]
MRFDTNKYPLYLKIAERIRADIVSGKLMEGVKLPSQRELALEFQTTLMTVRQALELLEDEELVRTEHGRGMFVSSPQIKEYDRERLFGFDTEMGLRHQKIETRLLQGQPVLIHPEAALLLGYPGREMPCSIRRLRVLDGMPIVLQSSFLAPRLSGLLEAYDCRHSLYEQIAAYGGQAVVMTKEILMPVTLDAESAILLARNVGAAAMLSARMSRSGEGEALVYDEAVIAGDSFFISAGRVGKRHDYDFNFGRGGVAPIMEQLLRED